MNVKIKKIKLQPENNQRLINLCGPFDDNLKQLTSHLNIEIYRHNNSFKLIGESLSIDIAINVLISLYEDTKFTHNNINDINPEKVHLAIKQIKMSKRQSVSTKIAWSPTIYIETKNKIIKPRTLNQSKYLLNIFNNDITFGIGPAGTGKTYLAIAAAIDTLEQKKAQQIILTRPVIEAGEKLGFLPGNINQKTDPYVRPLHDALFNIFGHMKVEKLIQKNIIEIVPLAYMRGRTLHNAVIILDEGQNTTISQMQMFLTRIGFNSKIIITGDITQIDLPYNQKSGLVHAIKILEKIKKISFNFFNKEDSIRHEIVSCIIEAYEAWNKSKNIHKK